MLELNATGTTFRMTETPEISEMDLSGEVDLVPEPDNQYDPNAIRIEKNGVHIGYIPKGDHQEAILAEFSAQRKIIARIVDADMYTKEQAENRGVSWKPFIRLEIDMHLWYEKNGRKFVPITKLLSHLNPTGDMDGLIRWACDAGSYDNYKAKLQDTADAGTALHKSIEEQLNAGKEPKELPGYLKTRVFKKAEHTVFDDDLGVAGQIDAIFDDRTVDWKSSKKPSLKHKMQVAFACRQTGHRIGEIVTFGGTTKRGYSVCTIDGDEIDRLYEVVSLLAKIYYKLNPEENQDEKVDE